MDWFISQKLKKIGKTADPSRAFVRALEKDLKTRMGHPVWWVQWSKVAAGATTALVLAGGSTGVYAFTSDNVLPGTTLYPIRTGIEQAIQTVDVIPAHQAKIKTMIQQRREREREILSQKLQDREEVLKKRLGQIQEQQVKNEEARQKLQEMRLNARSSSSTSLRDQGLPPGLDQERNGVPAMLDAHDETQKREQTDGIKDRKIQDQNAFQDPSLSDTTTMHSLDASRDR